MLCQKCGKRYVHERCFNCNPVGGDVKRSQISVGERYRIKEAGKFVTVILSDILDVPALPSGTSVVYRAVRMDTGAILEFGTALKLHEVTE
jgi:hypothetical protein